MDQIRQHTAFVQINSFLDLSPDPIVIVDDGAVIVAVNDPLLELTGYAESDLVGQPIELLVPRRLRDRHVAHRDGYAQSPSTRPMGDGRDLWLRTRDSGEVAVDISLRPITFDDARVTAAVIRDVSAAKTVMAELQETQRRLRGTIDALSDANDRLEIAAEFQREFISTASHELRTPLTAVTGFAEMLADRWEVLSEERRRDAVTAIHRNAQRQLALVDDMAHAAHIQMGNLKLRPSVVAIDEVIAEAIASVVGAEDFHVESVTASVFVDEGRLIQIVINLLTNALRYGAAPFTVEAEVEAGRVLLRVVDHGPGVPVEFIPEMFEAFAQASRGTRRDAKGTGLGLYISRTLSNAMEGDLRYRANPAGGAVFELSLPLYKSSLDDGRGRA